MTRRLKFIENELQKCTRELSVLGSGIKTNTERGLIIDSGDISDVDGLFALAQYAKTGNDVLFVMNYPAYLNLPIDQEYKELEFGLGYEYGLKRVLEETRKKINSDDKAKWLVDDYNATFTKYGIIETNPNISNVKILITSLAFKMAMDVWNQTESPNKGTLFFCIGGINDVNPFYPSALKNEMLVYSKTIFDNEILIDPANCAEGSVLSSNGESTQSSIKTFLTKYHNIFIDFNGSMAFLNFTWNHALNEIGHLKLIKGAFVQGGVYTSQSPKTIPATKNVLNRLSCATMNQLYSPMKSALFFHLMQKHEVPIYIVANNETEPFENHEQFLKANGIHSPSLTQYCQYYYDTNPYGSAKKPFDFQVALVVTQTVKHKIHMSFPSTNATLFVSPSHGATLISDKNITFQKALFQLIEATNTSKEPGDNDQITTKKSNFTKEFKFLANLNFMNFSVKKVAFLYNSSTNLFKINDDRFYTDEQTDWQTLVDRETNDRPV